MRLKRFLNDRPMREFKIITLCIFIGNAVKLLLFNNERFCLHMAIESGASSDVYKKYRSAFEKVESLRGSDNFCIMNINDIHLTPENSDGRYENLLEFAEASQLVSPDCAVVNGDIQDGNNNIGRDAGISLLEKAADCLRGVTAPVLPLKGNHDDNLWNGKFLMNQKGIFPRDFHRALIEPFSSGLTFDSENPFGNYYYRDFESSKVRVVLLNSVDVTYKADENGFPTSWGMWDYTFSEKQLRWIKDKALDFKDKDGKWGVVVCFHNPLKLEAYGDKDHAPINGETLENILKAFSAHGRFQDKDGTSADYSKSDAELLCVLHGHTHFDKICRVSGITYIVSLNAICYNNYPELGMPERIFGTASQNSFEAIVINRAERTITSVRFGAGKDYVTEY